MTSRCVAWCNPFGVRSYTPATTTTTTTWARPSSALVFQGGPRHGGPGVHCFKPAVAPLRSYAAADKGGPKDPFLRAMEQLGYSAAQQDQIISQLGDAGLWENSSSLTLRQVTKDFPEENSAAVSTFLIQDFGVSPLTAHQTRAALQHTLERDFAQHPTPPAAVDDEDGSLRPQYKSVVVDESARRRSGLDYGLPRNYEQVFPVIGRELQDFFRFMTVSSTDSQGETPIRAATANTYIRHAKLFLGWYWNYFLPERQAPFDEADLSLYEIFPSKEKQSAEVVFAFLIWLRSTRNISVSYEANLLRGLGKMLKFRFRKESVSEDDKSFDDIPVLRELRKLHREANRRQAVAPRVSDEALKWLSWPEYLDVVQRARQEVRALIDADLAEEPATTASQRQRKEVRQRGIATAFQKYLIVAFFSSVPDRQRTIRELEIGTSFVKNDGQWCIKHSPDDYKTGKTYGERPPLQLPALMTAEIDEFIEQWRPFLLRGGSYKHLFLQVRAAKPLSQDSVYQSVGRTCHKYTGKRTNPHLLRDMIVTHIRESSDASEQQLEALALFMGHSVQVQRSSYDRRTLSKKVEPAVALMEQVNAGITLPSR